MNLLISADQKETPKGDRNPLIPGCNKKVTHISMCDLSVTTRH